MKRIALFALTALTVLGMASCDKSTDTDPIPANATPETPRYMAAYGGKIYVSCYRQPACVARIDTATLSVEATCTLGHYQPEGIAAAGGRLFVASSWIADESGAVLRDNKVYVIDIASFRLIDSVVVGLNPQRVVAIDNGHVAVNYLGDYAGTPGGSCIIDAASLDVVQTGYEMTNLCAWNGSVYAYCAPYGSPHPAFFRLDPPSLDTTGLLGNTSVDSPYGIAVVDGDIYITSGLYNSNGDVYRFSSDGTLQWQAEAGVFTNKVEPVGDGTAYVLSEGSWGSSNASLGRVDLASGTMQRNVFSPANGRDLGDVAQDVVVYGNKAFVSVSFSNTIEVVNTSDNTSTRVSL